MISYQTRIESVTPGENDLPVKLCIHAHFYQPPREDPFARLVPCEPGAAPYANFNEKITEECYRPNAELGNFEAISYDMGPTLSAWLEQHHPDVYERIIEGDRLHMARYGVGNALAQAYNHTILPLANTRDKQTQILWGLSDFRRRYGHEAHGMWLAETAVDLESLDLLAQHGVTYTVLAPWQAGIPIDPSEPYLVRLPWGRTITVFFYHNCSGGVSFNQDLTINADSFAAYELPQRRNHDKYQAGIPQMLALAMDGETFGHHKPQRDQFLSHLVRHAAKASGFEICTFERFLHMYPARREVRLHVPSSWSCGHGVARWSTGCACTEGESNWKGALLLALTKLNNQSVRIFEQYASETLDNPWAARDEYLGLRNGWETAESFWERHSKHHRTPDEHRASCTLTLLEAQYYHQYSFTSCGWFFEDLDRIEPRNNIAFARRAISLVYQATGHDLQRDFLDNLAHARSAQSGRTGADIYRQLPDLPKEWLPL